jgi:hypothetical protein
VADLAQAVARRWRSAPHAAVTMAAVSVRARERAAVRSRQALAAQPLGEQARLRPSLVRQLDRDVAGEAVLGAVRRGAVAREIESGRWSIAMRGSVSARRDDFSPSMGGHGTPFAGHTDSRSELRPTQFNTVIFFIYFEAALCRLELGEVHPARRALPRSGRTRPISSACSPALNSRSASVRTRRPATS